ncbi:MAG TPA: FAD-dependent oxidoreductase [Armatimonadota bacterium]|nr:FAD-dependent oxidoreductase [Armatimonadota bacterium]
MILNRRTLLRTAACAASSLTMDGLLHALNAVPRVHRPLRVVIIGARLAGLCAAYELERRGHQRILLEADPVHVGGRVRTLRFGDGLYGEFGAMRIPASHHLPRHYIHQFGLPLRRFIEFDPEAYYYVRGRRERIRNVRRLDPRYAAPPTPTYRLDSVTTRLTTQWRGVPLSLPGRACCSAHIRFRGPQSD